MPSTSKTQQRLFGWALACKTGESDNCPTKVKNLADSMSEEELRKYIRHRDNNRCQNPLCEHKNFVQCVHHIDGDKLNCSPSNLITLCKICHQKIHVCKEKNEYKKMLQDIVIKLMDGALTTKEI